MREVRTRLRFIVPWRPEPESTYTQDSVGADGPHRQRLWNFARARWEAAYPDTPIVEGSSPPGLFNRSAAINDGAFGDWDIAVVIDADVVCSARQVNSAIERASQSNRVVLAYSQYRGLTPNMTARILDGYEDIFAFEETERPWLVPGTRYVTDFHESSCVVIPRAVFDKCQGFDERFVGWGQEDVAFMQAARILTGPVTRVEGPVWHLWHAHGPDRNPAFPEYHANQALGERYREATDRRAMKAMLRERLAAHV